MAVDSGLDDQDLIDGCLLNDRKMQEALYRKYAAEMLRICRSYEPDGDLAKDILQAAFLKVFRNLKNFSGNGSLHGWIRRIITNTAIDSFRRRQKEYCLVRMDDVSVSEEPSCEMPDGEQWEDILQKVALLPDGARHVFNLYALEGLGHNEIAEMLGISEGTSKSQLNRARQLLKQQLVGLDL